MELEPDDHKIKKDSIAKCIVNEYLNISESFKTISALNKELFEIEEMHRSTNKEKPRSENHSGKNKQSDMKKKIPVERQSLFALANPGDLDNHNRTGQKLLQNQTPSKNPPRTNSQKMGTVKIYQMKLTKGRNAPFGFKFRVIFYGKSLLFGPFETYDTAKSACEAYLEKKKYFIENKNTGEDHKQSFLHSIFEEIYEMFPRVKSKGENTDASGKC